MIECTFIVIVLDPIVKRYKDFETNGEKMRIRQIFFRYQKKFLEQKQTKLFRKVKSSLQGAMTFRIATLSIMTLSTMDFATRSMNDNYHNYTQHNGRESHVNRALDGSTYHS
jgi:hypothetical protein